MKYASSLVLGGNLIEAVNGNHSQYKKLYLLCPHCKDPVFFQDRSLRQTQNKLVVVEEHFKHFPSSNSKDDCENRSRSINQEKINKQDSRERKQRLKILQNNFWFLFLNNASCLDGREKDSITPKKMEDLIEGILKNQGAFLPLGPFQGNHEEAEAFFNKVWKYDFNTYISSKEGKEDMLFMLQNYVLTPEADCCRANMKLRKEQTNFGLYCLILKEIIDFLYVESSRGLLRKCLFFGFAKELTRNYFQDFVRDVREYGAAPIMQRSFFATLMDINWVQLFKAGKQNKYKGKSLRHSNQGMLRACTFR